MSSNPRRPPRQPHIEWQDLLDRYSAQRLWKVPDVPADELRVEARPKQPKKPVLINLTEDSPQKRAPAPVTSEPHISCAICLGSPLEQRPSATPCGHVFCHSCIIQAIKHTRNCPVCRNSVSDENVIKLHI